MGSRERDLSCIIDMVRTAYPDLPIMDRLDLWLAGQFEPPLLFVRIEGVAEKGNTLTSYRVIAKAHIAIHHTRIIHDGMEVYELISTDPLRQLLTREGFSFRGTEGLFINIDGTTLQMLQDKKDRTDITFQFDYTVPIPREHVETINHFDLEGEV